MVLCSFVVLAASVSVAVATAILFVPVAIAVVAIVLLTIKIRKTKRCDELDIAHKHGLVQAYGLDHSNKQHNGQFDGNGNNNI